MGVVQNIFNYYLNKIHQGDANENFKELLEFLEEAKNINIRIDKLEDIVLTAVDNDEVDLPILYSFDKYLPGLKEKIDNIIKSNVSICKLRCQYLIVTNTTDDEFVSLTTKAIKGVMVDDVEHIYLLGEIKTIAKQRNLHERIVNNIKTSGNVDKIVGAALSYEYSLINEIFGSVEAMYLYLSTYNFIDKDAVKVYQERLRVIDDYDFESSISKNNRCINKKIKSLKKID